MSSVSPTCPISAGWRHKVCDNCGTEYRAHKRQTMYGNYCQAKECANVYRKMRMREKNAYKGGADAQLICSCCGDQFTGWAGRLYCDKPECKRRKQSSKPNPTLKCSECGRSGVIARGFCPTHYSYWRRENVGRVAYMRDKVCAFCGKEFQAQTRKTEHCSSACGLRNLAGWSKSKEMVKWSPASALANSMQEQAPRIFVAGSCRICAKGFVSTRYMVTCSPECSKEQDKESRYLKAAKRRATKRAAFVAPVFRKKVFEADGYRCHICSKLTNRNAAFPHPKAPTIDHLIPLSLGGTHEPSNCRTACFLCNSTKSDRLAGDQLILFNM